MATSTRRTVGSGSKSRNRLIIIIIIIVIIISPVQFARIIWLGTGGLVAVLKTDGWSGQQASTSLADLRHE
ncbi:hypothetical protein F4823DRAFT_561210 [Ustulina deusta]|nr:hypothetical protein F4823DRAFT_561210 [Ustulina deusta]